MVGCFNRFRRPSVSEEVWHDQVVSLRELKQRLPDPPVLPVVAPVQQDEILPLPNLCVPHSVLSNADLPFDRGNQCGPFLPPHSLPISSDTAHPEKGRKKYAGQCNNFPP